MVNHVENGNVLVLTCEYFEVDAIMRFNIMADLKFDWSGNSDSFIRSKVKALCFYFCDIQHQKR